MTDDNGEASHEAEHPYPDLLLGCTEAQTSTHPNLPHRCMEALTSTHRYSPDRPFNRTQSERHPDCRPMYDEGLNAESYSVTAAIRVVRDTPERDSEDQTCTHRYSPDRPDYRTQSERQPDSRRLYEARIHVERCRLTAASRFVRDTPDRD